MVFQIFISFFVFVCLQNSEDLDTDTEFEPVEDMTLETRSRCNAFYVFFLYNFSFACFFLTYLFALFINKNHHLFAHKKDFFGIVFVIVCHAVLICWFFFCCFEQRHFYG